MEAQVRWWHGRRVLGDLSHKPHVKKIAHASVGYFLLLKGFLRTHYQPAVTQALNACKAALKVVLGRMTADTLASSSL
jgi:hypothetical protein